MNIDEQFLVLKKGSLVNGYQVPFWTDSNSVPDKSLRCAISLLQHYYSKIRFSHQLSLSSEQKQASVVWRTPSEVFGDSVSISFELESEDIIQRVVADCSLCASIAVCLDHYRRHHSRVSKFEISLLNSSMTRETRKFCLFYTLATRMACPVSRRLECTIFECYLMVYKDA